MSVEAKFDILSGNKVVLPTTDTLWLGNTTLKELLNTATSGISNTYLTITNASDTYLTKTDASNIYLLKTSASNYVTLNTAQTITGAKTFQNGSDSSYRVEISTDSSEARIYVSEDDGNLTIRGGFVRCNGYVIIVPKKAGTFALTSDVDTKQDTLVSGTNIKTINNSSILGSGNLTVSASVSGLNSNISFASGSSAYIDLQNSSLGLKFGSSGWYVTNMEAGSFDVNFSSTSTGTSTSGTVSFHNGSKGNGTWHVFFSTRGASWTESIQTALYNATISNTGFRWASKIIYASEKSTYTVSYFAIKYY